MARRKKIAARSITQEEASALRAYASKVGEGWKDELAFDWMREGTGHVDRDTYAILHVMRNQLGPSWLYSQEEV